jgi:hypothetical protein
MTPVPMNAIEAMAPAQQVRPGSRTDFRCGPPEVGLFSF